ncbi:MAG TPA: alpha/beta fold hydrolase [Polyangiaceae bacterium]|nr:alpha/beta fold hydrolase [Polyangiaceae bacterium]
MASATRLLLFAPGAGAPSSSSWMQAEKRRLEALGRVVTFDYPYLLEGRKSPDRAPVLIAAHEAALERASQGHTGKRVLVGKSMGGRMGCHVAVKLAAKPDALVCLGYPLVGQRGDVRDAVLLELETPVLFVQGTRDKLCPLERLESVRKSMRAPNVLYVVEGGDHSLAVGKRDLAARGLTQAAIDADVTQAIAGFLDEHA